MAAFSFDIAPLMQVSKDIQRIGAEVRKNERPIVKLMANEYKNDVQERLPRKTTTLIRSVHVEPAEEGGHAIAFVGSDSKYARQKEYGGIIEAKKAPYLVFQINGQWIQTKSVYQHPQPAWRPAFEHNLVKYQRMAKSIFNREEWDADKLAVAGLRSDITGGNVWPSSTSSMGSSGSSSKTAGIRPDLMGRI